MIEKRDSLKLINYIFRQRLIIEKFDKYFTSITCVLKHYLVTSNSSWLAQNQIFDFHYELSPRKHG